MMYLVQGERPDKRAGDGLEIEADTRSAAEDEFLKAHPGWRIVQVQQLG